MGSGMWGCRPVLHPSNAPAILMPRTGGSWMMEVLLSRGLADCTLEHALTTKSCGREEGGQEAEPTPHSAFWGQASVGVGQGRPLG